MRKRRFNSHWIHVWMSWKWIMPWRPCDRRKLCGWDFGKACCCVCLRRLSMSSYWDPIFQLFKKKQSEVPLITQNRPSIQHKATTKQKQAFPSIMCVFVWTSIEQPFLIQHGVLPKIPSWNPGRMALWWSCFPDLCNLQSFWKPPCSRLGSKNLGNVDGWNPKQPPNGCIKTLYIMGYLPLQLVSRISAINSITRRFWQYQQKNWEWEE